MWIFMRFPGGKKKALTLSYDDGVEQDIRLIDIMKKNGLKGTFNLNSGCYASEGTVYPAGTIHRRLTQKQVTKLYSESGMEVAVHGLTHLHLEQLPINLCLEDIVKDRENLEKQFGVIVRGMAYPYGSFNDTVIECMKAAGIVYSRTTISSRGFSIPEDEAHDNWNVIENFAEYVGGRDNIWYATNIEIYEYVTAYRQLVFGMDAKQVSNPTAYTLYFEKDGKEYCVKPGEHILL